MAKEKITLGEEAMSRLRDVLYGDDDIRSFDTVIHHILNELEQRTAELEAEIESSLQADPYLVRTYGNLNQREVDIIQELFCSAYISAGRKSRVSKKELRELGERFGLELTE